MTLAYEPLRLYSAARAALPTDDWHEAWNMCGIKSVYLARLSLMQLDWQVLSSCLLVRSPAFVIVLGGIAPAYVAIAASSRAGAYAQWGSS